MPTPLRVLLIESSETDRTFLLEQLRRGGYEPSWRCTHGATGLEGALAEEWEIALCNWSAPRFSGPQALARLQARRPDLPMVAFAADPQADAAGGALEAGPYEVVPLAEPARLLAAVDRTLREAELRRVRRRADEALNESGERFAQAFEHAPIGMAIVGIDGIILQANQALCDMFGYSPAEMEGMAVWRITHPDDMPATIEQLQRLVEGESDAWHLEKRYFHRDGEMLWGRGTTWLVRGADGLARYVVSQVQDITAQKKIEQQMRQQQAELAHVLRVATMGEMVAQIAHEIHQPLGSIANFANGLARRPDDVEATRAIASHIAREAMRAAEIIRRLRSLARKGDSKRERCEANQLVRNALRLIEPEIRQHAITLGLELAAEPIAVEVDRVQIEQVVLNLLRNAVEAMAANGNGRRLEVQTQASDAEGVVVSVSDSGIGLPRLAGGTIFDAFFTTKETGLGLGLSISRSIIEAHSGRLWACSNRDCGATVAFSLPARPSARPNGAGRS